MTEPLVGRYELVQEIGRGGFGLVEEYRDLILDTHVAVKAIAPHFIKQETKRLIREVDIMSFLYAAHPHVIDFSAMFVTRCRGGIDAKVSQPAPVSRHLNVRGKEYANLSVEEKLILHHRYLTEAVNEVRREEAFTLHIVMPLMKGDLTSFIRLCSSETEQRRLRMSVQYLKTTAAIFAFQLFFGLDYLHKCGIIHRDLKPENILVCLDDAVAFRSSVCIADLGLAREMQDSETFYVCTRYYRAPEVVMTAIKGHAGLDVWSMGCILYEMCTNRTLFTVPSALDGNGAWEGVRASSQLEVILNIVGTPPVEDILYYMPAGNAASYLQRSAPRPSRLLRYLHEHWILDCDEVEKGMWCDLITRCLSFFPQQRPTAEEACSHPLFQRYEILPGVNVTQNPARPYHPTFTDSETAHALTDDNKARILNLVRDVMINTAPRLDEEEDEGDEEDPGMAERGPEAHSETDEDEYIVHGDIIDSSSDGDDDSDNSTDGTTPGGNERRGEGGRQRKQGKSAPYNSGSSRSTNRGGHPPAEVSDEEDDGGYADAASSMRQVRTRAGSGSTRQQSTAGTKMSSSRTSSSRRNDSSAKGAGAANEEEEEEDATSSRELYASALHFAQYGTSGEEEREGQESNANQQSSSRPGRLASGMLGSRQNRTSLVRLNNTTASGAIGTLRSSSGGVHSHDDSGSWAGGADHTQPQRIPRPPSMVHSASNPLTQSPLSAIAHGGGTDAAVYSVMQQPGSTNWYSPSFFNLIPSSTANLAAQKQTSRRPGNLPASQRPRANSSSATVAVAVGGGGGGMNNSVPNLVATDAGLFQSTDAMLRRASQPRQPQQRISRGAVTSGESGEGHGASSSMVHTSHKSALQQSSGGSRGDAGRVGSENSSGADEYGLLGEELGGLSIRPTFSSKRHVLPASGLPTNTGSGVDGMDLYGSSVAMLGGAAEAHRRQATLPRGSSHRHAGDEEDDSHNGARAGAGASGGRPQSGRGLDHADSSHNMIYSAVSSRQTVDYEDNSYGMETDLPMNPTTNSGAGKVQPLEPMPNNYFSAVGLDAMRLGGRSGQVAGAKEDASVHGPARRQHAGGAGYPAGGQPGTMAFPSEHDLAGSGLDATHRFSSSGFYSFAHQQNPPRAQRSAIPGGNGVAQGQRAAAAPLQQLPPSSRAVVEDEEEEWGLSLFARSDSRAGLGIGSPTSGPKTKRSGNAKAAGSADLASADSIMNLMTQVAMGSAADVDALSSTVTPQRFVSAGTHGSGRTHATQSSSGANAQRSSKGPTVESDPDFPAISDASLRLRFKSVEATDRGAQSAVTDILSELGRCTQDPVKSDQLRSLLIYFTTLQSSLRATD